MSALLDRARDHQVHGQVRRRQRPDGLLQGGRLAGPWHDGGVDLAAIADGGPVSAAFYVFSDFMHYAGGVYARAPGSSLIGGHVIKILGWGEEDGEPYWLGQGLGRGARRLSPGWGENGFFKIRRGDQECAIEQRVDVLLAK